MSKRIGIISDTHGCWDDKYYTGKQWGHCESYDLCINAGRLGHKAATKLIADYAKQVMGQANDKSHE